jgi:hypothetical protein
LHSCRHHTTPQPSREDCHGEIFAAETEGSAAFAATKNSEHVGVSIDIGRAIELSKKLVEI